MSKRETRLLVRRMCEKLWANKVSLLTITTGNRPEISFGGKVVARQGYNGWEAEYDGCRIRLPLIQRVRLNCAIDRYLALKARAAIGD